MLPVSIFFGVDDSRLPVVAVAAVVSPPPPPPPPPSPRPVATSMLLDG